MLGFRKRYRENITISNGKYATLQIYPEYARFHRGHRKSKYKPTSDAQRELNRQNRFWKLVHLCNENFIDGKDLKLELTYSDDNLPADLESAKREFKNFMRRVNRARRKKGLDPAKCVSVIERGKKSGRFHHHLIISGGLTWEEIDDIWGKGYTRATKLRFDRDTGLQALITYMLKNPVHEPGKAVYYVTRNMTPPKNDTYAHRLSHRDLELIATYTDASALERLYPDFKIIGEVQPFYSDTFGAFYFFAQFVRKE